jgi:arsenate reductase (thioredoxin)
VTDALSNQYLAFADTMRMLDQRIGIFVNLPIDKLSKLSLQHQLEEIGHIGRATEPA